VGDPEGTMSRLAAENVIAALEGRALPTEVVI